MSEQGMGHLEVKLLRRVALCKLIFFIAGMNYKFSREMS